MNNDTFPEAGGDKPRPYESVMKHNPTKTVRGMINDSFPEAGGDKPRPYESVMQHDVVTGSSKTIQPQKSIKTKIVL